MAKKYDYLIIGAGLFGSTFAHEAKMKGKKSLVIDQRNHLGGNLYCENIEGITVHKYGPHIFHTNDKKIWDYISQFVDFNRFTNSPLANFKGEIYNLPFNMNTFNKLWGVVTPDEAKRIIKDQVKQSGIKEAKNLEEQAILMVGTDVYMKLIKGYTEKQWGRKARDLPASIIKRIPLRFTYDNNYYNDKFQGIPEGGYNVIFKKMLEGIDVKLNIDYFSDKENLDILADKIVFTGRLDEYYNCQFGRLEYRGLRFENEILDTDNYQGNAVINYTDSEIPYTRIIEHKHFEFNTSPKTIITKEYPIKWEPGYESYYPVNDKDNMRIYKKYKELADREKNVIFGGRLAEYKYYDMDQIIYQALERVSREFAAAENNIFQRS